MIIAPVCMSTKDLIRSSVTGKLLLRYIQSIFNTSSSAHKNTGRRCVISAVEFIAISKVFTKTVWVSV